MTDESPTPPAKRTGQPAGRIRLSPAAPGDRASAVPVVVAPPGPVVRRPERTGRIRLRPDVAAIVSADHAPHAVSGDVWAAVPEHRRAEVLERAAYFNIRNKLPDEAVALAMEHVARDEEEVEQPFDWAVARRIIPAFPAPCRDIDHRPSPDMLRMAGVVEALVEAEMGHPGAAHDAASYFAGFELGAEVAEALTAAFAERLAVRRAEDGIHDGIHDGAVDALTGPDASHDGDDHRDGREHDVPHAFWSPDDEFGGFGI